jgi:hypothetical protein
MKRKEKTKEKRTASPELLEGFRKLLAEIHHSLPAYFYGGNGILVPLPINKREEDKITELGLTRLVPDGHIDIGVLMAIRELLIEADDDFWPSHYPQVVMINLRKALRNKNSKLSNAIARAYGETA